MITSFSGEYTFLSNFYRMDTPMVVEGEEYPTLEHAFQTAKTDNPAMQVAIRGAGTPGRAKYLGRSVPLPDDWNERRIDIMRNLLAIKFADPMLKDALLATGTQQLIEGNTHRDTYWGAEWDNGAWVGENHLGILLMELRKSLRDGATMAPKPQKAAKAR